MFKEQYDIYVYWKQIIKKPDMNLSIYTYVYNIMIIHITTNMRI